MNIQRVSEDSSPDPLASSEAVHALSAHKSVRQADRASRDQADVSDFSHLMADSMRKLDSENEIRTEKIDAYRDFVHNDAPLSDDKILTVFQRMLNL